MATNDTFFTTLRDWSERKVEIIANYTAAAAKILKKAWYVDGFAGTGLFNDEKKGSSLAVAEIAQELQGKLTLSCLNIEADENNYKQLVENTCQVNPPPINLHGTFTDKIGETLDHIKHNNVICFLDPFGLKGIDYATIQKLVNRNTTVNSFATDLWLRFDTKATHRLRGQDPTKTSHFQVLYRAFGIQDPQRLLALLTDCNQCEITEHSVLQYLKRLKVIYEKKYDQAYTGCYPIYSLEGKYKYYLAFVTRHPTAINLASEIVYKSEKQYQVDHQNFQETSTGQSSLFSLPEVTDEWKNSEAIKRIKGYLTTNCRGKTITRQMITTNLIEAGQFGKFKSTHLTTALRDLQKDNFIIQSSSNAYSNKETDFTFAF